MPKAQNIQQLNADEQAIVAALQEKRDELGLTDAAFHRRYLPRAYSTWHRIQHDGYAGNTSKAIKEYEQALRTLENIRAFAPKIESDEPFYMMPVFESVVEAVNRAHARTDENRLVVFLAPTGGGKDAMCRHLAKTHNAKIVEGRESWRKSYYAGCADVCNALHVKGPWRSTREVEFDMLAKINGHNHTIVANEGNSFGPQTFNMFKLILNQTSAVVVVCAIPGIFDRMRLKSWYESTQFLRRAVAVISAPEIDPENVRPFMAELNFGDDRDICAELITIAANTFGRFNMVKRIIENLRDEHSYANGRKVSIDAVETAIAETEAFLRLYS
ncbi:MAG: hypothetical protein EOM20_16585 [Spartobacteria bacterium]|nr:hypothetical protein [Spartobacteria bacterium]